MKVTHVLCFTALVLGSTVPVWAQAIVGNSGVYSENFDSMGTAGTAPPLGWTYLNTGVGNNGTFTDATGIPATAITGAFIGSTGLTATTTPTATNNNGYNAAASAGNTADRVLVTAPTGSSANILQLVLQNNSGAAFSAFRIGYDTVRLTSVATANELPGFQLFFSIDNGTSFTNVAALNPTLAGPTGVVVPNTVGVTSVSSGVVSLGGSVASGANLVLRFVDDNAVATSPDQFIGLNNVVVTVPETSSLLLAAIGMFGTLGAVIARRRK